MVILKAFFEDMEELSAKVGLECINEFFGRGSFCG